MDPTFLGNNYLTSIPAVDASYLLDSAARLRNPSLFKECAILCMGPWETPVYAREMEDSDHYQFLDEHYNTATKRIAFIQWRFLQITTSCPSDSRVAQAQRAVWKQTMDKTASCLMETQSPRRTIPIVKFYRSLFKEEHGAFGCQGLFREELRNELPLNKTAVAGVHSMDGNFEEHFLFMYIEDSDLPWDVNDTSMDW
jgi:hypothetical protein